MTAPPFMPLREPAVEQHCVRRRACSRRVEIKGLEAGEAGVGVGAGEAGLGGDTYGRAAGCPVAVDGGRRPAAGFAGSVAPETGSDGGPLDAQADPPARAGRVAAE